MAEREGLERVVSEAQLRPGLMVEFACDHCDERHRTMLLGYCSSDSLCAACDRFGCGLKTPTSFHGCVAFLCTKVPEAAIWIVNPFAEDSSSATQKAKRPREVSRG